MDLNVLQLLTLTLVVQFSQQSAQQSRIQATCTYSYDFNEIYTCYLIVSRPVTLTDVLEITGTHLENHTDADVQAVVHVVKFNSTFNGDVLRKFVNMKSLDISGRNLLEINPNAFEVCPKLDRLIISYGQLTSFPNNMLKNCENLVYFEAMGQRLKTFPEDFFGNIKNLEEFAVPSNELTTLPEKLFHNLSKLKRFRIGFNKLRNLDSNLLINTPNLEEVSLFDNEFQHQDDITYALNAHTKLKHLAIDSNNFTNFNFRFFSQFQKLEFLSVGMISGPKLTEIHWQSLPSSLTNLRVREIGETIPENAFERLVKLTSLTLSGIAIENLQKDTFKSLTSLESFYLYDSSLKVLHPKLFSNQINLSHLLISNSQIEELPPRIFTPLVNIGIINIYNGIQITSSKIRRLNSDSFGKHPHLQNIIFSENQINEIERGIFSQFHPNMSYVGFYNNQCVSDYLTGENLDNSEKLEQCYKNWKETDPN